MTFVNLRHIKYYSKNKKEIYFLMNECMVLLCVWYVCVFYITQIHSWIKAYFLFFQSEKYCLQPKSYEEKRNLIAHLFWKFDIHLKEHLHFPHKNNTVATNNCMIKQKPVQNLPKSVQILQHVVRKNAKMFQNKN